MVFCDYVERRSNGILISRAIVRKCMSIHPFLIPRFVDFCIGDVDLPIAEAARKMPSSCPPKATRDEDIRLVICLCPSVPMPPEELEFWRERGRNHKVSAIDHPSRTKTAVKE